MRRRAPLSENTGSVIRHTVFPFVKLRFDTQIYRKCVCGDCIYNKMLVMGMGTLERFCNEQYIEEGHGTPENKAVDTSDRRQRQAG